VLLLAGGRLIHPFKSGELLLVVGAVLVEVAGWLALAAGTCTNATTVVMEHQ
jgi:hypothetical protein